MQDEAVKPGQQMEKIMPDNNDNPSSNNQSISMQRPIVTKKIGISAQRQNAPASTADPLQMLNRIGIIFDDSGSMAGEAIEDAKEATKEFLQVCNPNDTSISLYNMGDSRYSRGDEGEKCIELPLSSRFSEIVITITRLKASHGTPLYAKMRSMIDKEPITRAVIFSDGSPSSITPEQKDKLFGDYNEKKVSCDTVFIGQEHDTDAIRTMKEIADKTGGIFLHFKQGSTTFKSAFKYLAPRYRGLLMSGDFKERLERGEVK